MSRSYRLSIGRAEHIQQTPISRRGHPRRLAALWRHLAAGLALGLMGVSAVVTSTPVGAVSLPLPPHQLVLTLFAEGLQIYRSAELTPGMFVWQFFGPEATLFTDDTQTTQVGTHFNVNTAPMGTMTTCPVAGFACPSWQADTDGSAVTVGRPLEMMPSPNPDSIPELLLPAVSHVGDGLFSDITFVQRLDTEGGLSTACALPTGLGQQCDSAYTATYTFFAVVPEPGTWLLLGTGLVGLLGCGWRATRGISVRRRWGRQAMVRRSLQPRSDSKAVLISCPADRIRAFQGIAPRTGARQHGHHTGTQKRMTIQALQQHLVTVSSGHRASPWTVAVGNAVLWGLHHFESHPCLTWVGQTQRPGD